MSLTQDKLRQLIREELTKSDKAQIKKMISTEVERAQKDFKKVLKKEVEAEISKALKDKATKE